MSRAVATTLAKVAVIRAPGYPVGHPAPCYFNCPCGAKPALPPSTYDTITTCPCGRQYDDRGWMVTGRPA